ncbi:MAG: ABC transporter permease [bacterium]
MTNFLALIGQKSIRFIKEFMDLVHLGLRIGRYFPRVFKDRGIVIEQMKIVGADSLPLVILIGVFTGAIAALQATAIFDKFNMLQFAKPFIGASIAKAVFTELTPVLTALVIAGRVGASIAAQIGSMNVTEQIDALEVMAIDKDRFIGMPRIVATLAMMPVLAVFSNLVAIIGAYYLCLLKFNFSMEAFFTSVVVFFNSTELIVGLVKSMFFGGITALIGIHVGFRTAGGAEGVGRATVRAYTISAAAILFIDALFGLFF